jgi:hypothetical protein
MFTVTTSPITAGSVTVKYKADGDSSWSTIGSYSTVGGVGHDFYGIESSGASFKTFGEVKFRLESTGGVEITGFKMKVTELIGSNN